MDTTETKVPAFGPRGTITHQPAPMAGHGSTRSWTRRLNGKLFSFIAILMPNGERRYSVARYDGPARLLETGAFANDWTRLHFIVVQPAAIEVRTGGQDFTYRPGARVSLDKPLGYRLEALDRACESAKLTGHHDSFGHYADIHDGLLDSGPLADADAYIRRTTFVNALWALSFPQLYALRSIIRPAMSDSLARTIVSKEAGQHY
ncbi:hypothetical protein [Nocardia sp. NPDC057440]|uniref:hypothetical protein n=1 Tax=Nocardia sp. NPDC057440 TaxID=3346134 RepID=UPI0036725308